MSQTHHSIQKRAALRWVVLLLGIYLALSHQATVAQAQWATSGSDIYNTNTGNVGIGTSSFGFYQGSGLVIARSGTPTIRLENTLDAKNFELEIKGDGVHFAGMNSGQPFMFDVGAIERVRIDANGNVGIGTMSPANTLHLSR